MLDVETADASVHEASRRVQDLDRFSRSAPIGRAELATIVLQALAELGAQAEWTITPSITTSILRLMDEGEQRRYEEFEASVRRAAEKAGAAEQRLPSTEAASVRGMIEIDPVPSGASRTAPVEDVVGDEALAASAAEAVVYELYHDIVERAVVLVERSPVARERLWPLVWAVAALIPPPDISSRRPLAAAENLGA